MSRIYSSPITTSPPLPRQSIFTYLFPSPSGPSSYPTRDPDAPLFIDGLTDRTLSNRDVESGARRLATGLRRLGMKRGDVACVFGYNSLEWLNAVYGCLAAGVVVSTVNYGYTPPEVLHQLKDARVKMCFASPELYPVLIKALELEKSVKIGVERIVLLCEKGVEKPDVSGLRCIEEIWGDEEGEVERFEDGDENETAFVCYSSGTTGLAKGVESTHYNMTSQVQSINPAIERLERGKDVELAFLPFGHMYALALAVLQPLTAGIPVVVLPRFEEKTVFYLIEKYKITWALVVPPVLIAMRNSAEVDKYNMSSLRGVMSAAAPLSTELCQAVEKRFKNCRVTQGYGLTEVSPLTHAMDLNLAVGRQGSIGKLVAHTEARLTETETGLDVSAGQPGELWVQSPSVMKGYLRNPEATKKTFSEDGWFKTGDVAVVTDDGYFYIVDRLKELIKYKGFQVAPAELEGLLLTNPDIADAAVIGIPDREQETELPRAYVVARDGSSLSTQAKKDAFSAEIISWVQSKVANHKRLRGGCVINEAIPKSPTGKILRKNLRVMAAREVESEGQAGRSAKL